MVMGKEPNVPPPPESAWSRSYTVQGSPAGFDENPTTVNHRTVRGNTGLVGKEEGGVGQGGCFLQAEF